MMPTSTRAEPGMVKGRYVAQLMGCDSGKWEDSAYFDDPDRAKRFVQGMVDGNPRVQAGRMLVFDQAGDRKIRDA